MNFKQAIVALFMVLASIAGWGLWVAYEMNGLIFPVAAGYAALATVLLLVSLFADKIKRWMK